MQENSSAKTQNNNLTLEIQQLLAKISAIESANERQIYELTYKLTNESKQTYEHEKH